MAPLPKVKLRAMVNLPALVRSGPAINVVKENGIYTFSLDLSSVEQLLHVPDDQIANQFVLGFNIVDDSLSLIPFRVAVTDGVVIEKTDAGDVNVGQFDTIILINKGTPEATTINLPPADSKSGRVKIVDFAANAGTYNITIVADGTDVINGQSQWVLAGDGASVVLDPVTGGWAL